MDITIRKADGEEEIFDSSKLELSLERAGAKKHIREKIVQKIISTLRSGMTTSEIYRHAFDLLRREEEKPVAARYSVKRAVFDLGPSGFPFEQFVATILRRDGWSAKTGVSMIGKCAPHEVDVFAMKDGKRVGIEVKFHNSPGVKTDVKDTLYVYARFEDLKAARAVDMRVDEGWLVTNTRFTRNAIHYGQCVGLFMIGWDYPRDMGIIDMMEKTGVHPLTCLTTLTEGEKRRLLDDNIVLCRDIKNAPHVLREHGVSPSKIDSVLEEAQLLCVSAIVE